MNDRRAYRKAYYRKNKPRLAAMKAWRTKNDLDYRLRAVLRTIVQRCDDPRHASYKWYGGKGIKTELTLEHLKFMWKRDNAASMRKPSVDRENADLNYTLWNCCFRELRTNQKRGWEKKHERTKAIRQGMDHAKSLRLQNFLGIPAREGA